MVVIRESDMAQTSVFNRRRRQKFLERGATDEAGRARHCSEGFCEHSINRASDSPGDKCSLLRSFNSLPSWHGTQTCCVAWGTQSRSDTTLLGWQVCRKPWENGRAPQRETRFESAHKWYSEKVAGRWRHSRGLIPMSELQRLIKPHVHSYTAKH